MLFLLAVNMAVYFPVNRQREKSFAALLRAIKSQQLLLSIKQSLSEKQKQIELLSLALEGTSPGEAGLIESGAFSEQLESIRGRILELREQMPERTRPEIDQFTGQYEKLRKSWQIVYVNLAADRSRSITELVTRAEPLSAEVIERLLPELVRKDADGVERASATYHEVSQLGDRIASAIL